MASLDQIGFSLRLGCPAHRPELIAGLSGGDNRVDQDTRIVAIQADSEPVEIKCRQFPWGMDEGCWQGCEFWYPAPDELALRILIL